jgi:L-ribulose-5-phosphate 3-epimerase
MDRRKFINGAAALSIGSVAMGNTLKDNSELFDNSSKPLKKIKHNPIGVSSYSFWQFEGPKEDVPMELCIDKAAAMGFDGIELLLVQMSSEENGYLQKLKKRAFHAGLDLMGFSTHQGYLNPDKTYRDENIAKTIHQIELAYKLGIPTMRLNTGRWGTSDSFDSLMANKGI